MGTVIYLRQHGVRREADEPLAAMNITPLIDVMLVLLVMLIITVPMAVHKVPVDLPVIGSKSDRKPVMQKLALSQDGRTYWNGAVIDEAGLAKELRAAAAAKDYLQFETAGDARYERFDQLIATVKKSGITQIGFVGNDAFAKFGKPSSN
ncbi:MAG: biopolymer transport protein ExbD [Pseudomonadota bacterium]|jgi:biopolymer transport protein ExbD